MVSINIYLNIILIISITNIFLTLLYNVSNEKLVSININLIYIK